MIVWKDFHGNPQDFHENRDSFTNTFTEVEWFFTFISHRDPIMVDKQSEKGGNKTLGRYRIQRL